MAPDPYSVLGVPPSATDAEVRAAYRTRSQLVHPDLHQDRPEAVRREAERAMAQLTAAYEAVTADRGRPAQESAPTATDSAAYRAGRRAGRSTAGRAAAEAGEQEGGLVYRLGWMVGRLRR